MSATLAPSPLRAPVGPTLNDVLTEAWNDLSSGAHTECPICSAPMQPRWTATARVHGGRCQDCGTTLE